MVVGRAHNTGMLFLSAYASVEGREGDINDLRGCDIGVIPTFDDHDEGGDALRDGDGQAHDSGSGRAIVDQDRGSD